MWQKALEWCCWALLFAGCLVLFLDALNPYFATPVQGVVTKRDGSSIVVRYPRWGRETEWQFEIDGPELNVGQQVIVYYKGGRYPAGPYLDWERRQTMTWGLSVGGGMVAISLPFLLLLKRVKAKTRSRVDTGS